MREKIARGERQGAADKRVFLTVKAKKRDEHRCDQDVNDLLKRTKRGRVIQEDASQEGGRESEEEFHTLLRETPENCLRIV